VQAFSRAPLSDLKIKIIAGKVSGFLLANPEVKNEHTFLARLPL
jgi:hypothetical protein